MRPTRTLLLSLLALAAASCGTSRESGTPAELIDRGWQKFQLEEYTTATNCFNAALAQSPDPKLAARATYGLAMIESLGRRTDLGRVRELFSRTISLDPKGDLAPWAALAMVRHRHLPVRSDDAVPVEELKREYADVASNFPGTAAATEAAMYRISLFVQTLKPDDAKTALAEIDAAVGGLKTNAYRSPLLLLRARACETLRDYPAALAAMIAALDAKEIDPTNPNVNNILEYFRIGMMAEYDVGDFATARKYFRRFLDEYGRDARSFIVQRELERMDAIERAGGDTSAVGTVGMNPAGGLPPPFKTPLAPATTTAPSTREGQ